MRIVKNLLMSAGAVLAVASPALAETGSQTGSQTGALIEAPGLAALGIGIAVVGGALGQGKVIAAALDSIARNPGAAGQLFVPMILGLVLIESLVIYALVVALKLVAIF